MIGASGRAGDPPAPRAALTARKDQWPLFLYKLCFNLFNSTFTNNLFQNTANSITIF